MIVFWSMVAGAGIMLLGVLFGVVITDANTRRILNATPPEEKK